jgi:hypothetical protein
MLPEPDLNAGLGWILANLLPPAYKQQNPVRIKPNRGITANSNKHDWTQQRTLEDGSPVRGASGFPVQQNTKSLRALSSGRHVRHGQPQGGLCRLLST